MSPKHLGLVWVNDSQRYFSEIRTVGKRKPVLQVKIGVKWVKITEDMIIRSAADK